jgi:tRNA 2-thiouridine synthesizing protein A
MAHESGSAAHAGLRPDDTIGSIVRRHAGATEVLEAMDVNHCCGAHLTVREAAALAGVSLDALLAALEHISGGDPVQLDVRGLEPPQPMVRVLEALDRLAPGAELEVHHDRRPLLLYPQLDARGYAHATDEPEPGLVRIRIRRSGG